MKVAPVKRNLVSFSCSGLARSTRAKPEQEKSWGWRFVTRRGGFALRRAIIVRSFRGWPKLVPDYFFCASFAQVSLSVMVRLKIGLPGVLSLSSAKYARRSN